MDVLSVADVGEPVGRPAELGEPVVGASPDRLMCIGAVRSDEPDRPGAGKVALECDASVVRGPARVHVVAGAVEQDARVGRAVDLDGIGCELAGSDHSSGRPQIVEVAGESTPESGVVDRDDDVLLAGPRILCPVGRSRPDRGAVADDVFVVHQIRHAVDRFGLGPRCGD